MVFHLLCGFTGLEKSTAFVLQTTEANFVLQSLSLYSPNNMLGSNNGSSPETKFRVTPYLKPIFLEDFKLASMKLKMKGGVQAQIASTSRRKDLRGLRTMSNSNLNMVILT